MPLKESQLEKLVPAVRALVTPKDIAECCAIKITAHKENYEAGRVKKYRLTGGGEDELWFMDIAGAMKISDDISDNYHRREKF